MQNSNYSSKLEELYNLKRDMGLLDLKKFNNLISEIEGVLPEYHSLSKLEKLEKSGLKDLEKQALEVEHKNYFDISKAIDLNSELILNLHMELGNLLSQLEFKINQGKIQLKLERLRNPQKALNSDNSLNFNDLDNQIKELIDITYKSCEIMKDLIYIQILDEEDDLIRDSLDKLEKMKIRMDIIINRKKNLSLY